MRISRCKTPFKVKKITSKTSDFSIMVIILLDLSIKRHEIKPTNVGIWGWVNICEILFRDL